MSIFETFWDGLTSAVGFGLDPTGQMRYALDMILGGVAGESFTVQAAQDVFTEHPKCLMHVGSTNFWQLVVGLVNAKGEMHIANAEDCKGKREQIQATYPNLAKVPLADMLWGCASEVAFSALGTQPGIVDIANTALARTAVADEDRTSPAISAAYTAAGRLHLVARGKDNAVYYKRYQEGKGWYPDQSAWECIGGQVSQPPVCVSWGPGRLDVLAVGSDRGMWHKCISSGEGWYPSLTGWGRLGGLFLSGPDVTATQPGVLSIVGRGTDNGIYSKGWDDRWYPSDMGWASLNGATLDRPRIITSAPGVVQVVVRGTDGRLYQKQWSAGAGWMGSWYVAGGPIVGAPSMVSWGPNRFDVLAVGTDGQLKHKCWSPSGWYPAGDGLNSLGGHIAGTPAVASWGPGRLDVVVRSSRTNGLYHKCWNEDSGEWYPPDKWGDLGSDVLHGTVFRGSPTVVAQAPGRLDIIGLGGGGAVFHKSWIEGRGWAPGEKSWTNIGGDMA